MYITVVELPEFRRQVEHLIAESLNIQTGSLGRDLSGFKNLTGLPLANIQTGSEDEQEKLIQKEIIMNKLFDSIKQGLNEAIKFAEGDTKGAQVFKPALVDVKQIRSAVGMTQEEFAVTFGINLSTLRHWERGDRLPRGPALALLNLIQKDPAAILKVITQ